MPAPLCRTPVALRRRLAELGPIWGTDIRRHSDLVKELYAPLLAAAPRDGVEIVRDVAYGDHPRHRADLFRPRQPRAGNPVVLYFHGGAFVRGDKRTTEAIYDNVLIWFARQGYLGLNCEYRLAPEAPYPGGADDVARAVAWATAHVAHYGGNPRKLYLIGHSAGGTHVASYAFDPALGYVGADVVALVLISARLRADRTAENPNADGVAAYFGDDHARYDVRSPVSHCEGSVLPVLIATAEFENPLLDVYGLELAYRMARHRRRAPRFLCLQGHNHMSIVAHFNTDEDLLGNAILDFFDAR